MPSSLVFLSLVTPLSHPLRGATPRTREVRAGGGGGVGAKRLEPKMFQVSLNVWFFPLNSTSGVRAIFSSEPNLEPFSVKPAFGDRFVQVTALLIVWHHAGYSIGFASGIRSKLGGVSGNVGKMSLCNMGSALLRHSAKLAILHGGWKDSAVVDCCIFVSAQFASLFRFFFFLGWIFPCENL